MRNLAALLLCSTAISAANATPRVFLKSGAFTPPSPYYTCVNTLFMAPSPSGNDSNNGLTPGAPIATLAHAQAIAVAAQGNGAGYCVRYLPGIYPPQAVTISGGADTMTGYFVLVSDQPKRALLRPANGTFNTVDMTQGSPVGLASYIVIDNFDIQGGTANSTGTGSGGSAIEAERDHHIKIVNNILHDSAGAGVQTAFMDYLFVYNNIIYNNAWFGQTAYSGISDLQPGAFDSGTTWSAGSFAQIIANNMIFKNQMSFAITATHFDGDGIILDGWESSGYGKPALLENNLIFQNGGRCIEALQAHEGMIRNNTCFHNAQDAQLSGEPCEIGLFASTGLTVVNNVTWADPTLQSTAAAICDFGNIGGPITSNNSYFNNLTFNGTPGAASVSLMMSTSTVTPANGNQLGVNPLLTAPTVNAALMDFYLQTSSPARGTGTTAQGVAAVDLAGNPRVVGGLIDIGSYEGGHTPSWMLAGAADDLQFTNQLYTGSGVLSDFLTAVRSSVGTDLFYTSPPGYAYLAYPTNTVAIAYSGKRTAGAGLIIEGNTATPSITNFLLNSQVPVTQTTGTLPAGPYTLWINGYPNASATISPGSTADCGTAVAKQGTPVKFTITTPGTCVITANGSRTSQYPNTLFAFQLSNTDAPTSFMKTTGTTFTRGNDKLSLAGSPLTNIGATTGSVLINAGGTNLAIAANVNLLRAASINYLLGVSTTAIANDAPGGRLSAVLGSGTRTGPIKSALGWDGTGRSLVGNFGTVATDAVTLPTQTAIAVGDIVTFGNPYGGEFNELADWTTRLPDATLQGLTR